MQSLGIARRPKQPRRNRRRGTNPGNAIGNRSGSNNQKGHEFLTTVPVPAGAILGQNLYQLEVNPSSFPQLSVFASQYTQWRGTIKMNVEALGNAFATSSVTAAYIADPDTSDLPVVPLDLLRVVESVEQVSRKSIHLQDPASTHVISAPWRVSTNPWKFVNDTDVSDRANGIFVIVALGDPGTTPINLKISASYDVSFQGRKYTPLESASATTVSAALGVNNSIGNQAYTNTTGSFNWVYTPGTFTLVLNYTAGFVPAKYFGSWSYGAGTYWFANAVVAAATTAIVNRPTLNTMLVGLTSTTYVFSAALAVPPVAATAYTWNIRPRNINA